MNLRIVFICVSKPARRDKIVGIFTKLCRGDQQLISNIFCSSLSIENSLPFVLSQCDTFLSRLKELHIMKTRWKDFKGEYLWPLTNE